MTQGLTRGDRPSDPTAHAIDELRSATSRTIGTWSDTQLDAVIHRLRQDTRGRPDNFALLMFLEDARLHRHEARALFHHDGHGSQPRDPI